MQAIYIRVPHVRDGLIVANVGGVTKACGVPKACGVANMGGCSYQNWVVILNEARSAESKDLRLTSSHRRTR
jgi:hypothetical protein